RCLFPTPRLPPGSTLFPYTTLFRSQGGQLPVEHADDAHRILRVENHIVETVVVVHQRRTRMVGRHLVAQPGLHFFPQGRDKMPRSEEHTSELQSRENLVCRLLLEKK